MKLDISFELHLLRLAFDGSSPVPPSSGFKLVLMRPNYSFLTDAYAKSCSHLLVTSRLKVSNGKGKIHVTLLDPG